MQIPTNSFRLSSFLMSRFSAYRLIILLALLCTLFLSRAEVIRMPTMRSSFDGEEEEGTRWAILVAGSSGYGGCVSCVPDIEERGLKEENIVVFMYDDLANNPLNPWHGAIINHPKGHDVYTGVPKGFDPSNGNVSDSNLPETIMASEVINQRDTDLLFMWKMCKQLDDNSKNKSEILKEIKAIIEHRFHLDSSIDFIGKLIFGSTNGPSILKNVRSSGQPLVDDWACLKSMVRIFESHCDSLMQYGMKHMRAFANICNWDVSMEAMKGVCISACGGYNSEKWSPLSHGYSA